MTINEVSQAVRQWGDEITQETQALACHPGRTAERRLSEACARATAKGARTVRTMIAMATGDLKAQRLALEPEEIDYVETARQLVLWIADFTDLHIAVEAQWRELFRLPASFGSTTVNSGPPV